MLHKDYYTNENTYLGKYGNFRENQLLILFIPLHEGSATKQNYQRNLKFEFKFP